MKKCLLAFVVFTSLLNAKEHIYFITHAGAGDPFWTAEFHGAQQAAKDLNLDLSILSPEQANDITRQIQLLDSSIAAKPDGIAVTVSDNKALSQSLNKAKSLGIPVVAFNSRPAVEDRGVNPYLAYVGMDDYEAGKLAGKTALASGRLTQRVVVAVHQPGHVGLESRFKGIHDALQNTGLVVDKMDTGVDPSQIQAVVQGYLKKHPETTALFCVGPPCTHAVGHYFASIKSDKTKTPIHLSGFDLSDLTLQYIDSGVVDFTIDQQPYQQGYLSIVQLALHLRAKIAPSEINTGSSIVDRRIAKNVMGLVKAGLR